MYRQGQRKRKKTNIAFYIIPVLVFFVVFILLLKIDIKAKPFDLSDITKVESVLIKNGDTIDTFASEYFESYSDLSLSQYKDYIIKLNNLSSENITAGNYLLLPVYN